MPEIEIRLARSEDFEQLSTFEHGYYTEYVWQMDLALNSENEAVEFRRIRLPRRVFVPYPRERRMILDDIEHAEAVLLAFSDSRPVGYLKILAERENGVARVTDLIISSPMRRNGVASGLLLATLELGSHRGFRNILLELQSKNDPAIQMAHKLGFNFCGFRDHYFPNQELALFYSRITR